MKHNERARVSCCILPLRCLSWTEKRNPLPYTRLARLLAAIGRCLGSLARCARSSRAFALLGRRRAAPILFIKSSGSAENSL
jgi:hypothetical protein